MPSAVIGTAYSRANAIWNRGNIFLFLQTKIRGSSRGNKNVRKRYRIQATLFILGILPRALPRSTLLVNANGKQAPPREATLLRCCCWLRQSKLQPCVWKPKVYTSIITTTSLSKTQPSPFCLGRLDYPHTRPNPFNFFQLPLPRSTQNAISFLISAMARPGLSPLGHVRVQLRIVWQRYRLIELLRASLRCSWRSSRESTSQRYDCSRMAGPRYSSEFHQYDGHEVEQHAHRMHSYSPSSFLRSALLWRYSLPLGGG